MGKRIELTNSLVLFKDCPTLWKHWDERALNC